MKTSSVLKKTGLVVLGMFLAAGTITAQEKQQEKIQKSTEVLMEFAKMKESIPAQLMKESEGIVIIPNLINAGLGVGGKRGKGIAMVKQNGSWSDPVFITLTGGSVGFQAGVQAIDLVLLFKNAETLTKIGKGTFTLGGDISVAAGPVGRNTTANTDYKLDAEVYSYSRSKGLFGGISINGTVLDLEEDDTAQLYGKNATSEMVLSGSAKASNQSSIKNLKQTLTQMY